LSNFEKRLNKAREFFYLTTRSEKENYENKLPNYYKCQTKIESEVSNDLCHLFRQKERTKIKNSEHRYSEPMSYM